MFVGWDGVWLEAYDHSRNDVRGVIGCNISEGGLKKSCGERESEKRGYDDHATANKKSS